MIELATLGRAAVYRNGIPLNVPPDGPGFMLLVLLALDGARSKARLADLFWPDHEPHEREAVLDEALQRIHRVLGRGVVTEEDGRLSLDPGRVSTDVERFREAVAGRRGSDALALYRGRFLEEVDASVFPELEAWIEETRRSLAEMARWAREHEPWEADPAVDGGLQGFFRKIRTRRVVQVGLLYLGFAAGSLELSNVLVERDVIPHAAFLVLLAFHIVGFPLAVTVTWMLEGARADRGVAPAEGEEGFFQRLAGSRLRAAHLIVVFAVLALGSGTAWLLLQDAGAGSLETAWSAPLPEEKRIAVLPFRPLDDDPRTERFALGLTEALTRGLSAFEGLRGTLWVIPSEEVLDRQVTTPARARDEFGVNLVITGSARHSGDSVWAEANLIDAEGLRQLRPWSLDAPLSDVGAIQARILGAFRDLLDVELRPEEEGRLASGGTQDPQAYQAQIAAQGYLQHHWRKDYVEEAVGLFEAAVQRDPDYVLALAGLGKAYLRRYEHTRNAADLERGRSAVEGALALDDRLAAAHVTRGMILAVTGRREEALAAFDRALELEPHSEEAHVALGEAYAALNDPGRAEATLSRAVDLRPGWWTGHNALGRFYFSQGRYGDAAEQFGRVVVVTPENARGWSNLGGSLLALGRLDDAFEALERSVQIAPTDAGYSNLGTAYFLTGHYEEAAGAYETAVDLGQRDLAVWWNLASAYRLLPGHEEEARETYRRVVELAWAALEVNRNDPELMLYLAAAHSHLGEPDRARSLARQSLDLAGGNVDLLFRAGEVFERIGDRDEAIRWIAEALRRGYSRELFERAEGLEELRADPRLRQEMEAF